MKSVFLYSSLIWWWLFYVTGYLHLLGYITSMTSRLGFLTGITTRMRRRPKLM